ncbi:MAG: flavodoxin domain-containing protein [Candidatus Thorarchaeota archaeon]
MTNERIEKTAILYGSRYGSTEDVAVKIGEILKESGIDISVNNLKEIIKDKKFNLSDYNSILLGTGIYAGQWAKSAKKFLKDYSEKVKERNLSYGVFILCGEASDITKIPKLKKRHIEDKLNKYGLKSHLIDVFGGVLDLTEETRMGKFEQKIIKMINKKDPNVKLGQRNDFRDWQQIEKFALSWSNLIKNN